MFINVNSDLFISHQDEEDEFIATLSKVDTPAYVLDIEQLLENLSIFETIKKETNCKVLLALKAFSNPSCFDLISHYLDGTASSSLNEARLGKREFGKEVHIYAPAYKSEEFQEIQSIASHVVFNSISQWKLFRDQLDSKVQCGLRINPKYSEVKEAMYNPCVKGSRLGVTLKELKEQNLEGLKGLHFHVLCEQGSDVLDRVWKYVEKKVGRYIEHLEWFNIGGGHLIADEDYDVERLIRIINYIQDKYGIQVVIEPGAGVVVNTGYLVASVLDIGKNGGNFAILDTSATAHMPDVLETPYRPDILRAKSPGVYLYTYQLGGLTCLAGDIIGTYSFQQPLSVGDKLIFEDMAQYTMVKNTTFNGISLPSIYTLDETGELYLKQRFGYDDFRLKLGNR
jgi:carboxynorspermidine decarboxylase